MIHIRCYQPPLILEDLIDGFGFTYKDPLIAVYTTGEYSSSVMGRFQREPVGLEWRHRTPFGNSSFLNPDESDIKADASDRLVGLGIAQPNRPRRAGHFKSKIL